MDKFPIELKTVGVPSISLSLIAADFLTVSGFLTTLEGGATDDEHRRASRTVVLDVLLAALVGAASRVLSAEIHNVPRFDDRVHRSGPTAAVARESRGHGHTRVGVARIRLRGLSDRGRGPSRQRVS